MTRLKNLGPVIQFERQKTKLSQRQMKTKRVTNTTRTTTWGGAQSDPCRWRVSEDWERWALVPIGRYVICSAISLSASGRSGVEIIIFFSHFLSSRYGDTFYIPTPPSPAILSASPPLSVPHLGPWPNSPLPLATPWTGVGAEGNGERPCPLHFLPLPSLPPPSPIPWRNEWNTVPYAILYRFLSTICIWRQIFCIHLIIRLTVSTFIILTVAFRLPTERRGVFTQIFFKIFARDKGKGGREGGRGLSVHDGFVTVSRHRKTNKQYLERHRNISSFGCLFLYDYLDMGGGLKNVSNIKKFCQNIAPFGHGKWQATILLTSAQSLINTPVFQLCLRILKFKPTWLNSASRKFSVVNRKTSKYLAKNKENFSETLQRYGASIYCCPSRSL